MLRDALAAHVDEEVRPVFLALVCLCAGGSSCTATVAEIVAITGICRRSVCSHLAKLEQLGNLQIERGGGRGKASNYRPIISPETVKRVQVVKMPNCKNGNGFNETVQPFPLKGVCSNDDCTLSDEIKARRDMDRRTRVAVRRQQVQDGYLAFIAMLDADQFATVPAVAKSLGMSPSTVRSDLDAIFRTMDISYEDQRRLRKSQRKPAHWGKLRVVNGGRF